MALDLQTHKVHMSPNGHVTKVETKPYRRFVAKGRPTVYLQSGEFYYEAGDVVPEEKLKEYGLVKENQTEAPTSMEAHPDVMAIINSQKRDALKEWAYEVTGGVRSTKRTVVVEKDK